MVSLIRFIPFVFVLLWSTGFVGAKYVLPYAEPFTILAVRVVITIGALGILMALRARRIRFSGASLRQMVVGALIHGGYLGGVFFAISHGLSAGVSALIVGLQPILTAMFMGIFRGERLSITIWLGLLLGFVGVALVIIGRGTALQIDNDIALIAAFIALISIVIGTVLQKTWGKADGLLNATLWQYFGALTIFAAASYGLETQTIEWSPILILALLWLFLAFDCCDPAIAGDDRARRGFENGELFLPRAAACVD